MLVFLFKYILCLLPALLVICDCNDRRVIIVRNIAQLTEDCGKINSTVYCKTLGDALDRYYDYFGSSDFCIKILENQTLANPSLLYQMSNFTLSAPESNVISVTCRRFVKLSITDSTNIFIENIIFISCGAYGGYSVKDFFPQLTTSLSLSSAMYFRNTTNISISGSQFTQSVGYSIIFVDCYNNIALDDVIFKDNQLSELYSKKFSYGGGVIITYSSTAVQKKNDYQISNCIFESLAAIDAPKNKGLFDVWSPYGNGGGLTLILESYSFVTVTVNNNTTFCNNTAHWGAGFYAAIIGTTHNTTVKFDEVLFSNNSAKFSGGAIRVVKRNFVKNVVNITSSKFVYNSAEIGGALSQIFQQFETNTHKSHDFVIVESLFYKNSAKLGSAIYFKNTNASIFGGEIKKNSIILNENASTLGKLSTVSGVGAVYIYKGVLTLGSSFVLIENNLNTAFVLEQSDVFFAGKAIFHKNKGSFGGAFALYENSRIILTNKTDVLFLKNTANKGGAIYVHSSGPPLPFFDSSELLIYHCFMLFQSGLSKDFLGKMNFTNNKAIEDSGNSIFATTLQGCLESKTEEELHILTNWTGFHFSNPRYAITTDPINISIDYAEWSRISPGFAFSPKIQLLDERNNSISGPIDITLNSTDVTMLDNSSRKIVYNETIELTFMSKKHHNSYFNLVLKSPSGRPIPKVISDKLDTCPFGYTYVSNRCVCLNRKNQDRLISKCVSGHVYLYDNVWAAEHQDEVNNDNGQTLVCPSGYCQLCHDANGNPLIDCKYNPKRQCAENRDQSSKLCGVCKPGWAVEFGSEHCSHCSGATGKYWIPIVIVILTAVFVILILFLNLDIYDDFFSVTLFFYQTVDILFTPTQQIMIRDDAMKSVIGVLQLNGLQIRSASTCFSEHFDDADKLMFNYVLPCSMIVWLVIFIWLCNSQCNVILSPLSGSKSCKALIFVLFFAYSDFTRLTFDLLQCVEINGSTYFRFNAELECFRGKHLGYGLFAIFILIFVVIGFPLTVLLLICGVRVPWLPRNLFPIERNFDHCFEKKWYYQMFSLYYFLAKIILLAINTQPKTQLQASILGIISFLFLITSATWQPYTDQRYSYFDIAILFCFTFIAFCSNGKLKLLVHDDSDQILGITIEVFLWLPLVLWFGAFFGRRIFTNWESIKQKVVSTYAMVNIFYSNFLEQLR